MTAPLSFALTGNGQTVLGHGIGQAYTDPARARAALMAGEAPIILGALPFDVTAPAALMRPEQHSFGDALPSWPQRLPSARVAAGAPAARVHAERIERALAALRDPGNGLRKVVLARALELVADEPLDAQTVLGRLVAADPDGYGYFVDLSPAGADYTGRALVGATPELLVARHGEDVTCQPFAGSAPRSPDPAVDAANGTALAASAKNLHEHALVVEAIREALDPWCDELAVAPAPQLRQTAALWHLSTPIRGRLRESSTSALDLALALHPTPAVGGVPAAAAAQMIAELEADRGFYAGTAGWCDRHGDGRWVVSIRCAVLSADRRAARAYSGGGIVADSDVDDEIAETTTKFTTIFAALGVPT